MRATLAVFFLTGFVSATWAARVPAVAEHAALSAGELGLAFLALEAGAVAGLSVGAALTGRLGSRAATRAGFALFALALIGVGAAGSLATLALALAVMAGANSVVDVAINVQGAALERRAGRALLSRLHAGHAFGVLAGGLTAVVVAGAGVAHGAHFAVAAVTAGLLVQAVAPSMLAGAAPAGPSGLRRPSRKLLGLGAVAFCAFALDGAAANWSAVHLRSEHGASGALAAAAFAAFGSAVALGRLGGDRLVEALGRERAVRGGALLAAGGAALVALAPSAGGALAGWALLGAGVAPIAPTVLGAAAAGPAPAAAVAAVSTLGYLGSFAGPPVIGGLAEAVGLSAALSLLVVVALAATLPQGYGRRA